jgi:hypothetical protein
VASGIGGRLADLAMAGWEVTAVLADCTDSRPLRILGVAIADLDWLVAGPDRDRCAQVLTVAGDVWGSDDRVRRAVRSALGLRRTEIAVWRRDGAVQLEADLDAVLSPTRHRLSAAGRAFKARALIAAHRPPLFEPTESYWTTGWPGCDIHACI